MNFPTDWRNRRNQFIGSAQYQFANYYTDAQKTDMKNPFGDEIFHNLHLIPEPLKKNLADTLVTNQKGTTYEPPKQEQNMGTEYSTLSGIASFFSGMMNALSGAVFKRARSPAGTSDVAWQQANTEYKNGFDPSAGEANVAMSECKTAAAACEDKLNQVRQLLTNKCISTTRASTRRPRRVFVDPSSVEEHFEDAFAPEDFVSVANDTIIEYFSPLQYQEQEFYEVDAPKIRPEGPVCESQVLQTVLNVEKHDSVKTDASESESSRQVVMSCEDKVSKLKALLQNKHNNARTKQVVTETPEETMIPTRPLKSIPITKTKDKKFKNPHRLCTDKRQKAKMRQNIQEDMLFANEINLDDTSSVENSPLFHSLEKVSEIPSFETPREYFDEISGRFQTTSATSSEDSYQIVFNDIPKRIRSSSECDSEDSFIVFEDSPDSCYTSNDVFGDSGSECSDSDSEVSDSGCGNMRLSQSMSRTVSNLTDDSLYDEVDCPWTLPSVCKGFERTGLLLDERKKALKKDLPPKKVQFSAAPPRVHVLRVWAFAARQARAGHWERGYLDRERFKRRIADVDVAVSWVLKPQHRSRVMFQRFMPWWNAQKRKELADQKQREEEERITREQQEHADNDTDVHTEKDSLNEDVSNGEEITSGNNAEESDNNTHNDIANKEFRCETEKLDSTDKKSNESKLVSNRDIKSDAKCVNVNSNSEVVNEKFLRSNANVTIGNELDVDTHESHNIMELKVTSI